MSLCGHMGGRLQYLPTVDTSSCQRRPSVIARGQHDLFRRLMVLDEITALSRLKENHIPLQQHCNHTVSQSGGERETNHLSN